MIKTRDIQERILGPRHPDTAFGVYNLGRLAARRGDRDEAFRLINEALDRGLAAEYGMNMREDTELPSIRADPRFDALVARAESRATARK